MSKEKRFVRDFSDPVAVSDCGSRIGLQELLF